jgi:hypothetical protein
MEYNNCKRNKHTSRKMSEYSFKQTNKKEENLTNVFTKSQRSKTFANRQTGKEI